MMAWIIVVLLMIQTIGAFIDVVAPDDIAESDDWNTGHRIGKLIVFATRAVAVFLIYKAYC